VSNAQGGGQNEREERKACFTHIKSHELGLGGGLQTYERNFLGREFFLSGGQCRTKGGEERPVIWTMALKEGCKNRKEKREALAAGKIIGVGMNLCRGDTAETRIFPNLRYLKTSCKRPGSPERSGTREC